MRKSETGTQYQLRGREKNKSKSFGTVVCCRLGGGRNKSQPNPYLSLILSPWKSYVIAVVGTGRIKRVESIYASKR